MHDTWGIPSSTFLTGYLIAAAFFVIGALMYRRALFRGRRMLGEHIGGQQVAYLAGGARMAVYASFGGLRTAGAVGVDPGRVLARTGPLPRDAPPLDRAVYDAVGRDTAARLSAAPQVAAVLGQLREELEQAGLLLSSSQRAQARAVAFVGLALVALGVARIAAGSANGKPVGFLVLGVLFLGVFSLLMLRTPTRTRAGTAALAELRQRYAHLSPRQSPAFSTYGPAAAALGIGLFGAASLYALDPEFAAYAGAPRPVLTSTGDSGSSTSSSCSSSSSSCSSGSSCGGGGGGGCGG